MDVINHTCHNLIQTMLVKVGAPGINREEFHYHMQSYINDSCDIRVVLWNMFGKLEHSNFIHLP